MDREILVKTMDESYSPNELAAKLVECEEELMHSREDIRGKDTELMYLRETNWVLKDIIAKLTERSSE